MRQALDLEGRISTSLCFLISVSIAWNFCPPQLPLNSSIDSTSGRDLGLEWSISFILLKIKDGDIFNNLAVELILRVSRSIARE